MRNVLKYLHNYVQKLKTNIQCKTTGIIININKNKMLTYLQPFLGRKPINGNSKCFKILESSCLPQSQVKQDRPRSDCFCRSSLIMVFPVCFSDEHFVNLTLMKTEREKCSNFRTFTVHHKTVQAKMRCYHYAASPQGLHYLPKQEGHKVLDCSPEPNSKHKNPQSPQSKLHCIQLNIRFYHCH